VHLQCSKKLLVRSVVDEIAISVGARDSEALFVIARLSKMRMRICRIIMPRALKTYKIASVPSRIMSVVKRSWSMERPTR
jgi:hypothetical protein